MHNSKAVVAKDPKHLLKHTMLPGWRKGWPLQLASTIAYRGCGVPLKLRKKYFRDQGGLHVLLEKHELLCLYSSLDVANHTEGV